MSLSTLVFGIIYPVSAVIVCQLWSGHWAWHLAEVDSRYRSRGSRYDGPRIPNGEAWFMGYLFGILIGAAWPVVALSYITKIKLPAVGAERRGQLGIQEERIKELERQLDIR